MHFLIHTARMPCLSKTCSGYMSVKIMRCLFLFHFHLMKLQVKWLLLSEFLLLLLTIFVSNIGILRLFSSDKGSSPFFSKPSRQYMCLCFLKRGYKLDVGAVVLNQFVIDVLPTIIYEFEVKNRNTGKGCEIWAKLALNMLLTLFSTFLLLNLKK